MKSFNCEKLKTKVPPDSKAKIKGMRMRIFANFLVCEEFFDM